MAAAVVLLTAGVAARAAEKAADEPLIPAPLNALLPKITPGMTRDDVRRILSTAYPYPVQQDGPGSGQGGNMGFRLDDRFWVMFSAKRNAEQEYVVSKNASISVFDYVLKRRLDIKPYYWEKSSDDKASEKEAPIDWLVLRKQIDVILRECHTIKPGMTRADLLKVFQEDGGLTTAASSRYVHRRSHIIKVDVQFFPADPNRRKDIRDSERPTDIIIKISKPYLERMFAD